MIVVYSRSPQGTLGAPPCFTEKDSYNALVEQNSLGERFVPAGNSQATMTEHMVTPGSLLILATLNQINRGRIQIKLEIITTSDDVTPILISSRYSVNKKQIKIKKLFCNPTAECLFVISDDETLSIELEVLQKCWV